MKSFRMDWKWNGDGIRLLSLRKFLEARGFNLQDHEVRIRIDDEGNWDFFNPPKKESKPMITVEPGIDVELPIERELIKETAKDLLEEKPRRKTQRTMIMCKKCGTEHWPFHKCPKEKEK